MINELIFKFLKIPRFFRILILLFSFLSLFILPNRYFYRIFEIILFIFLVTETKDTLKGGIFTYILLSAIEVGKNFPSVIVSIPINFSLFFYLRNYTAAFVLLDSDILLLFIIYLIIRKIIEGTFLKKSFKPFNFDIYYLLFILILFVSTLFSQNPGNSFIGFLLVFRGLIIFILFRFINLKIIKKNLFLLFTGILLFQSILGILQYIKKAPIGFIFEIGRYLYASGINQQEGLYTFFRPTGTFTEPNLYALILNMLIPFVLISFLKIKNESSKVFFGLTFFTGSIAIFLSFSRMGWFIYFLNLIIIFFIYKNNFINEYITFKSVLKEYKRARIYLILFLSVFMVFFITSAVPRIINLNISIFEKWGSFNSRLFLVNESFKIININPLLGVGFFNFVPNMVALTDTPLNEIYLSSVNNIYLLVATEAGLPALFIFLLFIRSLFAKGLLIRKTMGNRSNIRMTENKDLLYSFLISIFSFFFGGMFLSYFYAGIQYVFLNIILGLYANLLSSISLDNP